MPLAGQTVQPIGLNSFSGHSGVTAGVIGKKTKLFSKYFCFNILFYSTGNVGPFRLQLVVS